MMVRLSPTAAGRRRLSKALFPLLFVVALIVPANWGQRFLVFQVPSAAVTNLRGALPGVGRPVWTGGRRLPGLAARGGDDEEDDYVYTPALVSPEMLIPGKEFDGVVKNTANFGAFVDIGFTVDGLVPISKLRDGRTENVRHVVEEGQSVKVWVVSYDGDSRLVLSMSKRKIQPLRQKSSNENLAAFKEIDSSEWLPGKVVSTATFGAFVELDPPGGGEAVEGLLHISQIKAGIVQNVGEEVKVRVLSVDLDMKRMALTTRPEGEEAPSVGGGGAARNVDLTPFSEVPDTEWLDGEVVSIAAFGAFVSVKPPGGEEAAQGLVHISQIKDGGMVMDVADEVAIGDEVKVRVRSVDVEGKKLSLSMRQEGGGGGGSARRADLTAFQNIPDTEWLTGRVKGFEDFGAFVEVTPPDGGAPATGLVHVTQITEGFVEDPQEELELDQDVKVRVLECDLERSRLALSLREIPEDEDEE